MASTSAPTTFRVRGLPLGYSKAEAETLIRSSLQIESEASIRVSVHSLAQASGSSSDEMTATVDFDPLPPAIASAAGPRYQQDFIVDRVAQEPLYLTLDTHFDGWTPLHFTPDEQCQVEQVPLPC